MKRAHTRLAILRQSGFTLVELIVVMVVLATIAGMGAIVMRDGMLGYLRGREITSADSQARLALERITRELREIGPPSNGVANIAAGSCDSSTFDFVDIYTTPISYTRSTNTLLRNGQSLADNVTDLRFYCLQDDGRTYSTVPSAVYYVTVSMVVSTENTSASYRSTVKAMSF